jgi:hypothetical protein
MRIFKDRFYKIEEIPGLSGFKQWDKREISIISGIAAQSSKRIYVTEEAYIQPQLRYELDDGHLPGYRPVVLGEEAKAFLANNPYSRIKEVE